MIAEESEIKLKKCKIYTPGLMGRQIPEELSPQKNVTRDPDDVF